MDGPAPRWCTDDGSGTWALAAEPVVRGSPLRWAGLDGSSHEDVGPVDVDGDGRAGERLFDDDGDGLADRVLGSAEDGSEFGFLDTDPVLPTTTTQVFAVNDGGTLRYVNRSMTTYELSDQTDEVIGTGNAEAILGYGGEDKIAGGNDDDKISAGDGADRPLLRVFQRVECDAHKLDSRMVVAIPSPHGGYETRKIRRLWVIVIIEVESRAVLGYHLSLHPECSAEDVLRTVKRALTRWAPRELLWSGNAYVEGAGLPSAHHERYLGACWDEFSVDGAMANICDRVERQLREVVGSTILKPQDPTSYTSRRSKDDRPFIESFFGQLARGGFHRLSTTTGSKPSDKRGADPCETAAETQFQLEYAEELLDTLIANYNVRPHSGLGWRSPLAQLDFLTSREPERIRQADAGEVQRMVSVRKLCTLKGGVSTGRRPYFQFASARYSAEWLALRTDLLGKLLWLQLEDEDDARFASVSNERGEFLGVVRAAPPWNRSPHTLYMRQAIRGLEKRRMLHLSGQCDAVEELIRYAEGSKDKKLPPHPAYLEARRVLQKHAQALAGQPVPGTPAPHGEASDPPPGVTHEPRRPLPSMQMAKTW